jgi:hypothetical protein
VCGGIQPEAQTLGSLRAVILRNTLQDLALARRERAASVPQLWRAGGWDSRESFCQGSAPAPRGPEWWLRVRGFLYQGLRLPELELQR